MPPFTVFRTAQGATPQNSGDSGSEKDLRSRQMDELCRISEDSRREVYGPNWDDETLQFYNLRDRTRKTPTFRPQIRAPQLQILLLSDATDLTDASIRVHINHKENGRDEQREKAFQEHWKQEKFNFYLLQSQIYAQFSGSSFLQVGYDPLSRQGEGNVWLRARKQQGIYVDPISPWPDDWTWCIIEDQMYLDEIKLRLPDHAAQINPKTAKAEALAGPPAGGIEMPPGPMSVTVRGLPGGQQYNADGLLKVRTLYCKDSTLRDLTDAEKTEFAKRSMPIPKFLPKYPNGRMIVDAEGTILVDGDSWVPLQLMWPIVPVWALPPYDTVWAPAPSKITKSLQDASERLMTQTFENAYRTNNAVVVINAASGITADSIGGLPGELIVVDPNAPQNSIEFKYPPQMPAQMVQLPMQYLQLQKELQGFTQSRQGNPGAGNISADLFESSVSQSQSITRLKSRLFAYSVQRVAELAFATMCVFQTNKRSFYSNRKIKKAVREATV
jgi:hypothetical protein